MYEDGVAVGQFNGARIIEPANALETPQRVIEPAVLLHQDNDVFRVQISRAISGSMAYALWMESGMKPDTPAAPDNMAASLRKSRLLS